MSATEKAVGEFRSFVTESAREFGAIYRQRAEQYAQAADELALSVAAGETSVAQATTAMEALADGIKSDALTAGYDAVARKTEAMQKAVVMGFRILAALA